MNSKRILVLPLILLGFSGCWVDEARPSKEKTLNVVADRLTPEDSTVIGRFAKQFHVKVKTEILGPDEILKRIKSERFNADVDILVTEDVSLRKQLHELKALKTIRNTTVFSKLERQFNNRHHYWVPVSHDPLIVTSPKDTSGNCADIDFRNWHRRDSLRPVLAIKQNREVYLKLLGTSANLNRLVRSTSRAASNESVYALSEFVGIENRRDSLYHRNAHACRAFLIDNQRYVSRIATVSIYRYGRNSATAEHFLAYYTGNSYSVASGRNHLPTRKNTSPNWYIRSLSIR
jgi:hypothetical protein